jgi:hypothetical protein
MPLQRINMSYPKPRSTERKIIPIARADSSTEKCFLPKDAIITGVYVIQSTAAVTGAASYNLGWSGATTALLNAFSLPTSTVGFAAAGSAAGATLVAGTKLDSDKQVIGTFTVGTSSAGGTGFIVIEYFVAGPGEDITD